VNARVYRGNYMLSLKERYCAFWNYAGNERKLVRKNLNQHVAMGVLDGKK